MNPFHAISGLIHRILASLRPSVGTIEIRGDGFDYSIGKGDELHVRWRDIARIVAYKRDLGTVDEIRVAVELLDSKTWVDISEEDIGYGDWVTVLADRLPLKDCNWWSKVAFPAFETNLTVLYQSEASIPAANDWVVGYQ